MMLLEIRPASFFGRPRLLRITAVFCSAMTLRTFAMERSRISVQSGFFSASRVITRASSSGPWAPSPSS